MSCSDTGMKVKMKGIRQNECDGEREKWDLIINLALSVVTKYYSQSVCSITTGVVAVVVEAAAAV